MLSTTDPIVLRSSLLPYRGLGLGPRSPVREPVVSPVYQDPTDPTEEPADRATSPTAPLSPAILAQAEALGYDYVKIFEFVRNEIELEWTAGSLRGAEGALEARRGNAVDQASLLVALLRGSGAAARFVHGVVELDLDQLQGDLGLSGAGHVLDFFARSGIAHEPVLRGGAIDAIELEHTWVAARVPYTNYRGAVVDRSGWTWLPLDPALTQFTTESATGVLDDMGFDAEAFRTGYLSEDRAETPLEQLRTDVEAHLVTTDPAATWADQLATRAPVAEALGLLPTSQSYKVVSITGEAAVLDEARRATATFVIRSAADPASAVVLDESLLLQDVAGRRVTLSYLPATVDDHRLVLAFGGFSRVPAYLVDVRPQIKVGGVTVSVGDAVPLGRAHRLAIRLDGAWGREEVTQTVVAGSYVAVAFGAPTAVVPRDDGDDAADTEGLAARLLSRTAYGYATAWDASEDELAQLFGLTLARPMPSVTLAINAAQVTEVDGLPFALSWQGVQLDAALRVTDPVGEDSEPWRRLSALEGSALERRVLEELLRVDSISTARGLARARALAIEIVEVTGATVGTVLPTLEHPDAVLRLIQEQAQAGQRLEVPRTQVAFR
ncbi:MAG: transglutaminase-like domain-containing protein, partial [Acidobacteriota bacterium]